MKHKEALPALFRRVHYEITLTWMTKDDIMSFFQHFLSRFVHDCPQDEWSKRANAFVCEEGPWCRKSISVDMVKQYLMRQITLAFCGANKFGEQLGDAGFRIDKQEEFFQLVCDAKQAREFLAGYAIPLSGDG